MSMARSWRMDRISLTIAIMNGEMRVYTCAISTLVSCTTTTWKINQHKNEYLLCVRPLNY
jgi:hypothetical protein